MPVETAPQTDIGRVADGVNQARVRDLDRRLRSWGMMMVGGGVTTLVGWGMVLAGGPLTWLGALGWTTIAAGGLVSGLGTIGLTGNILSRFFRRNRDY